MERQVCFQSRATENGPAFRKCFVCSNKCAASVSPQVRGGLSRRWRWRQGCVGRCGEARRVHQDRTQRRGPRSGGGGGQRVQQEARESPESTRMRRSSWSRTTRRTRRRTRRRRLPDRDLYSTTVQQRPERHRGLQSTTRATKEMIPPCLFHLHGISLVAQKFLTADGNRSSLGDRGRNLLERGASERDGSKSRSKRRARTREEQRAVALARDCCEGEEEEQMREVP